MLAGDAARILRAAAPDAGGQAPRVRLYGAFLEQQAALDRTGSCHQPVLSLPGFIAHRGARVPLFPCEAGGQAPLAGGLRAQPSDAAGRAVRATSLAGAERRRALARSPSGLIPPTPAA